MLNEPFNVSVWLSGLTNDAVDANDADTAFKTYDAVCAVPTKDAVDANEADVAADAVVLNMFVVALNVSAAESTRKFLAPVFPSVNAT
jgi:hypothetical protein